LDHLLFAAYLILFSWLITKTKFFTRSGLTISQLIIFFLLKVIAGIFYGWIGVYYGELAQMVDTWAYHYQSIKETELLRTHPIVFFTDIFSNTYHTGYFNFFSSENSWWNDLKATFFIKILAIFNLLSNGNYYINVIFYSFLSLFGPIAIYRVMQDVFPNKKIAVVLATFLIPSFLYWTSGLHKEGILFTALALIIYHIYFGLKEKHFGFYRVLVIIFGFILILALRNFLIVPLIPVLLAWILSDKYSNRIKPYITYSIVALASIILFFSTRYISTYLDMPNAVVIRQQEFLKLQGGSVVPVKELQPTVTSFIINAPQAFSLSVLRPYFSDIRHLLSMAAAVEINFFLLLFLIFLIWRKNGVGFTPFILFCIFFSFLILMMIGYSVNVLGAIVRYRSIVLPLLIIPMIAKIDWGKIYNIIFGNITIKNNI
jgi:hypothetical protein